MVGSCLSMRLRIPLAQRGQRSMYVSPTQTGPMNSSFRGTDILHSLQMSSDSSLTLKSGRSKICLSFFTLYSIFRFPLVS